MAHGPRKNPLGFGGNPDNVSVRVGLFRVTVDPAGLLRLDEGRVMAMT